MKTIFIDTETTGLIPGQICQLSYIIQDNSDIIARNYFFTVSYIEPDAYKTHKLSIEDLRYKSKGFTFAFHSDQIYRDYINNDLAVAHNIAFDMKFLEIEFSRCNYSLKAIQSFCTMKELKDQVNVSVGSGQIKHPSLKELMIFYSIKEIDILQCCHKYFGLKTTGFHDARYDVIAVMLCYNKYKSGKW